MTKHLTESCAQFRMQPLHYKAQIKLNTECRADTLFCDSTYIIPGCDVIETFLHSLVFKLKANHATGSFLGSICSEYCMRCGHLTVAFFFLIVGIVVRYRIHKTIWIDSVLEHSTLVPRFVNGLGVVVTEFSAIRNSINHTINGRLAN